MKLRLVIKEQSIFTYVPTIDLEDRFDKHYFSNLNISILSGGGAYGIGYMYIKPYQTHGVETTSIFN